jgi:hypothetical protein
MFKRTEQTALGLIHEHEDDDNDDGDGDLFVKDGGRN